MGDNPPESNHTPVQDNVIAGNTGTYRILEEIGRGAYGLVYNCIEVETGVQVAAKRTSRSRLSKEEEMGVRAEINLLQQLHHEHIVRYIEAVRSEKYLDILMELVEGGSLYSLLKSWIQSTETPQGPNDRVFPEEMVVKYVRQVLLGLNYLHEQGIVHRDIKSANLLTTKNSVVKLADFGVSIIGEGSGQKEGGSADEINVAGTPFWMAPEVISLTAASTASDIWSLGCTVIEMLTGAPPYFHLSDITAMFRIVSDDCPPLPTHLSGEAEDFLRKCFVKDMAVRATAFDLLKHPWIDDPDTQGKLLSADSFTFDSVTSDLAKEGALGASGLDISAFQESDIDDEAFDFDVPDLSGLSMASMADDQTPLSPRFPRKQNEQNGQNEVDGLNFFSQPPPLPAEDRFLGDDPFLFIPEDVEAQRERDRVRHQKELWQRVKTAVSQLNDSLTSSAACETLIDVFTRHSEQRYNAIHDPGLLPILEVLESDNRSEGEIANVLNVVVAIVSGEEGGMQSEHHTSLGYPAVSNVCEDICMAGFLPAIARYSHRSHSMKVRVAAAKIVEKLLEDERTMRMFISCHGFTAIKEMLEPDLIKFRELITRALDGIKSLLSMQNQRYKRDFCRRFAYCGLLERIVEGIVENVKDPPLDQDCPEADDSEVLGDIREEGQEVSERQEHVVELATLLMTFAARADGMVKEKMASNDIICPIMSVLRDESLPPTAVDLILACVRDISRDPGTHSALEKAQVIQTLIKRLSEAQLTRRVAIISTIHNLCIVSRARQQLACRSGLVVYLMQFIRSNDTMNLKSLCIDIYSGLAAAGSGCRNELWRHDGVDFYVDLLEMLSVPGTVRKWQARALKSLGQWLEKDGASRGVESKLIQSYNVDKICRSMTAMHIEDVEQILEPYHQMVTGSIELTIALGKKKELMTTMIEWINGMYDIKSAPRGRLLLVRTLIWHAKRWDEEMKMWAMKGSFVQVIRKTARKAQAVTVKREVTRFLKSVEAWSK